MAERELRPTRSAQLLLRIPRKSSQKTKTSFYSGTDERRAINTIPIFSVPSAVKILAKNIRAICESRRFQLLDVNLLWRSAKFDLFGKRGAKLGNG